MRRALIVSETSKKKEPMTDKTTIAVASDHAGFEYKESIKKHLEKKGFTVEDFGTDSRKSADYPHFIRPAAEAVADGKCSLGIVVGGSGNGEAITANKVPSIRCAVIWDDKTARWAKEHNNANIISLGQRTIEKETALRIVDVWLNAEFKGGRHQRRIDLIESGAGPK